MKKLIVVLGVVGMMGMVQGAGAQPPDTLWTRTFGGSNHDVGKCVQQTTDNGYIIVGSTSSFGGVYDNVYLLKTDTSGILMWQKNYGGSAIDYGECVQQTTDGGYIIVGRTNSYGSGGNVYLIKTNAEGDTTWTRNYGGPNLDCGYYVQQTSDGGYIITGYYTYGMSMQVYLIKTDANGIQSWQRTFGGNSHDVGYSVKQTSDGGFIITGYTTSFGDLDGDLYLIKTDTFGDTIWTHTFGGWSTDIGYSVIQTSDSGYIITGITCSFGDADGDVYLIKTDQGGNLSWTRTFGGYADDCGYCVQQTTDGGYIVAGYESSFGGFYQVYLIKTYASGSTTWQCTFGGSLGDYGNSVQQTEDGGYIIAGRTNSYGAGNNDVYLIKMDAEVVTFDVNIIPLNPPILIPANGGSFQFNASVQRNQAPQAPFYAWARDRYPDGTYTNNLLGPVNINPPVGVTVTRQRTQVVPGSWPAGQHWYIGYAHTSVSYPASDADSFSWTKSTTGDGGATVWEAVNYGEPFPGEELTTATVSGSGTTPTTMISPNPFNASTVASFELLVPSRVSLKVYDTAGRLIATLVDGWREAGEHSVTFDGSKLAAGIYLVNLHTGEENTVEKIVLLK